jgi:hypothetical protein
MYAKEAEGGHTRNGMRGKSPTNLIAQLYLWIAGFGRFL